MLHQLTPKPQGLATTKTRFLFMPHTAVGHMAFLYLTDGLQRDRRHRRGALALNCLCLEETHASISLTPTKSVWTFGEHTLCLPQMYHAAPARGQAKGKDSQPVQMGAGVKVRGPGSRLVVETWGQVGRIWGLTMYRQLQTPARGSATFLPS